MKTIILIIALLFTPFTAFAYSGTINPDKYIQNNDTGTITIDFTSDPAASYTIQLQYQQSKDNFTIDLGCRNYEDSIDFSYIGLVPDGSIITAVSITTWDGSDCTGSQGGTSDISFFGLRGIVMDFSSNSNNTSTSTDVDNPNQNLFNGFILMYAMMYLIIWFFRRPI